MLVPTAQDRRADEHALRMYRGDVSARRPPLTREEPWRGPGETTFFKINDDDLGRIRSAAIR